MVGTRPAVPTIEETVMSAFSAAATWIIPSTPERILTGRSLQRFCSSRAACSPAIAARAGLNFRIWDSSSSLLFPAASATMLKRSGNFSTTARVEVPMDPVEPRMEIRLIMEDRLYLFL